MSSPQPNQSLRLYGWVLAIAFTVLGLIFLPVGAFQLMRGLDSNSWPATEGVVTESEIESKNSSSEDENGNKTTDTDYSVEVRYT
jgi:uncharacterized protein (DUF58 family)